MSMLESILAAGGIRPFGQPIYDISGKERRLYAIELLSRGPANTPFESPAVLFEYARRKHAEMMVDRRAIELGLRALANVRQSIRLAVNVHASTLGRDGTFVAFLLSTADACGIPPHQLTVEIVEHAPVWNKPEFLDALERLRSRGVQIALDDVGAGFANFEMILDAHPTVFKADAYLVRLCHKDAGRLAILRALRQIATEFGGTVVAEGVETTAELQAVTKLGIHLVQGYLTGLPVPITQLVGSLSPDLQVAPFASHVILRHPKLAVLPAR